MNANIFDIQSFSVHDGPGTRTTIFFKGCPLKCQWCANPESWDTRKEILWRSFNCIGCGRCIKACSRSAINFDQGMVSINKDHCKSCTTYDCVASCLSDSLQLIGETHSLESLMSILDSHRDSWGDDGGITASGGEPLLHHEFLHSLFKACQDNYIHTAIETTALCDKNIFMEIMNYVDFAFIDIKHMDPIKHTQMTGVSNSLILENIKELAASSWNGRLIIRTPIIESFNDSPETADALADFMSENNLTEINLLPFHRMGESKWSGLGREYPFSDYNSTPDEKLQQLKKAFTKKGINCYLGSDTPF